MNSGHGKDNLLKLAESAWPLFCERFFDAAIDCALPQNCLPAYLPAPHDYKSVKLIAFGKSARDMAAVVEAAWPDVVLSGLIVCPYGASGTASKLEIIEASHPLPDANSVRAAGRALEIAGSVGSDELLLVLVSGGGSSLLSKPIDGVSLDEKRHIIDTLMRGGAAIEEINCVRRAMSQIKGGGLLMAASGAGQVMTLTISDVISDKPAAIASGPTVPPDEGDRISAAAVLLKHGFSMPEQPKCRDMEPTMPPHQYHIVANGEAANAAAAAFLKEAGFTVVNWGHDIEGEARDVAANQAQLAIKYIEGQVSEDGPIAFLSGGELTVTVIGEGEGGPNQEYVLALMNALPQGEFSVFAADTDGLDGCGGAAGAFFCEENYSGFGALSAMRREYLRNNDSCHYFKELECLFKAKNSSVNVNDLRVICWIPAKTS